jgi:hypothetical protein
MVYFIVLRRCLPGGAEEHHDSSQRKSGYFPMCEPATYVCILDGFKHLFIFPVWYNSLTLIPRSIVPVGDLDKKHEKVF